MLDVAALEAVLSEDVAIVSPAESAVQERAAEVSNADSPDYTLASEYRPASGVLIDADVKPYLPYD